MKKQIFSINELLVKEGETSLKKYIEKQSTRFQERFSLSIDEVIEVSLQFDDSHAATEFYNEIRFNAKYQALFTVRHHEYKEGTLWVGGRKTLFDYFGSYEPNLLTISRELGINFKINFVQAFSGTTFSGEVIQGELLSRQCLVEVSNIIPELGLGLLGQIGSSKEEFDLLLTRFYMTTATRLI